MTSGLQDSTILGFPARAVSYEIGDVAGAKPCFPGNNAACLTWFATDTTLIPPVSGWPSVERFVEWLGVAPVDSGLRGYVHALSTTGPDRSPGQ